MRKVPKNSIKISKCRRVPVTNDTTVVPQQTQLLSKLEHTTNKMLTPVLRTDTRFIDAKEYINIVILNGAIRIIDNQLILNSGNSNKSKPISKTVTFIGCPFTNKTLLLYVGATTDSIVVNALNDISKKVTVYTTPLSDTITETVINEYKIDHYSTAILNIVKKLYTNSIQVCRIYILATHDTLIQKQYDQLATVLRATYNTDLIEVHDSQLGYGLLNAKREPLTIKKYCDKINEMEINVNTTVLKTIKVFTTDLLSKYIRSKTKTQLLRDKLLVDTKQLANDNNINDINNINISMIRIGLFYGVVSIRELYISLLKQQNKKLLNELLSYAYFRYKFRYNNSLRKERSVSLTVSLTKGGNTLTVDTLKSEITLINVINSIEKSKLESDNISTLITTLIRKATKLGYDRDTLLLYLSSVVPDYDRTMYTHIYFN